MNLAPEVLSLLCDPLTHESLSFADQGEELVSQSGRRFPIFSDIPVLLENSDAVGQNERYQALYDRLACLYDFAIGSYACLKSGGTEKRRGEYLAEMEIREGFRVLEVSIGTGQNLRFLPSSATYFGLDISIRMLKRCRRNLRRWKRRAALLVQGAAEHLPFVDAVFDSVLHMGGINFFNDKAQALREMVRVAKPGTKIVVVDETEKATREYEKTLLARSFYRNSLSSTTAPVDCLPSGMRDVHVRSIANGELYCLSFRCPD
jgi:ubiquinone/menaquinone biosynthesis C-methylase UbiE